MNNHLLASVLVTTTLTPLTLIAFVDASQAANLLLDSTSTTIQTLSGFPFTQGSEFTLSSSTTVRSLGYIDAEGDGLSNSHEVAIWNSAGTLVTPVATVTPSSSSIASANGVSRWFLTDLAAPVTLGAGTYRIGGFYDGVDRNLLNGVSDSALVTRASGYVRTDTNTPTFAFPNLTFAANRTTVTFSDQFASAQTVPEPLRNED
jgi:hypothetical protein